MKKLILGVFLSLFASSTLLAGVTGVTSASCKIDAANDEVVVAYTIKNSTIECPVMNMTLYASTADMEVSGLVVDGGVSEDYGLWLWGTDEAENYDMLTVGSHVVRIPISDFWDGTASELSAAYGKNGLIALDLWDGCATDDTSCSTALAYFKNGYKASSTSSVGSVPLALYKKAKAINGVYVDGDSVTGTSVVKIGTINKKTGKVKVTVTLTPFVGKKVTASVTCTADDEGYLEGDLSFKTYGAVPVIVGPDGDSSTSVFVSFDSDSLYLMSGTVGGKLDATELEFLVDADISPLDGYEWIVDFPSGEPIYVKKGTSWSFNRAPTIKYKKVSGGYELQGLDDEKKTNYSALKLTYAYKTGVFKGTFKLYASNECCVDGKPTLKTYTAKVTGVMIDGVGYGAATVKIGKTTYTMPVWVEGDID